MPHHRSHPLALGTAALAVAACVSSADAGSLPLASHFDLTALSLRPAYSSTLTDRNDTGGQYLPPDLADPPMPLHKPAKLKVRGRHVRLRVPFR